MQYLSQVSLLTAALLACARSVAETGPGCDPVPSAIKLGPTLTIAEVDAIVGGRSPSFNDALQDPQAFQLQARWALLKQRTQPGDEVHQYVSSGSGGFAVTRKACLIAVFGTWAR